jgi:hypothetical protein
MDGRGLGFWRIWLLGMREIDTRKAGVGIVPATSVEELETAQMAS